ncbi:MAG: acyltransferase [Clostridia bacterium]|nr:acyltransferase [Clostridia bacterium]
MNYVESKLLQTEALIQSGLDAKKTSAVLDLLGLNVPAEELSAYRLWGDYLPKGIEEPYTEEQRFLHILWEAVDRSPIAINCAFSIPFRAQIAKKLFKKCGEGFIANEGCRFNYGHKIEVGDNVCWNHCCYIDSKGGVKFGDYSMMTEYSKIFTHGHSESDHTVRSYAPVEIKEYAKIYTNCTILPGVTVGKSAIVATGAIVTKSVDDFTLVAGIPAKPLRNRKMEDDDLSLLNHYTFADAAFQVKK